MNLFQLAFVLQSTSTVIEFLREKQILAKTITCCGMKCAILKDSHTKDGEIFRCSRCRKKKSIRHKSFFQQSKFPLKVLLVIVYFYSKSAQLKDVVAYLGHEVDRGSVLQWYTYCREICSLYLVRSDEIKLGENGSVVHIDECFMGGNLKYHRGNPHRRGKKHILFGMIDSLSKKCVVRIVPNRTSNTLVPIIKHHCVPNCKIWSDEAAAYHCLTREGFTHRTVKHKTEFKAQDGTHTNLIENLWSHIKHVNKKCKGTSERLFSLHVDEFIWFWNRKHEPGDVFDKFLGDIARFYKVTDL